MTFHLVETCLCNQRLYASWYNSNPYASGDQSNVIGILPAFYSSMISSICGTCKSYSKTTVYFDRTKSGHKAMRSSESDLKSSVCLSSFLYFYFIIYIIINIFHLIFHLISPFRSLFINLYLLSLPSINFLLNSKSNSVSSNPPLPNFDF